MTRSRSAYVMHGDIYIRLPTYITFAWICSKHALNYETQYFRVHCYERATKTQKRSQILLNSIMRAFVGYNILNGGVCYYSYLLYYYIDSSCDVVSIYNLE